MNVELQVLFPTHCPFQEGIDQRTSVGHRLLIVDRGRAILEYGGSGAC